MDGRLMLYVGSAVASAFTMAYIFWGTQSSDVPSGKKTKTGKSRREVCPGLENTGNTCFLNALLQGLAPCRSFVHWLYDFLNSSADKKKSKYTSETLHKILKVLNNEGDEEKSLFCPAEVIHALRARGWYISSEEQDAHELFHVLTQSIDEEKTGFQCVLSLFDVQNLLGDTRGQYQSETTARNKLGALLPTLPSRTSEHPFRGQLATQLQCSNCKTKKPVRYGQFDSLTLTIPDGHWGPLTLDRLLRHLLSYEVLHSVSCEECSKQTVVQKPSAVMSTAIGKLPKCLCIHIQRSVVMNNGIPLKRDDYVEFPELLSMSKYVQHRSQNQHSRVLDLFGGQFDQQQCPQEKKGPVNTDKAPSVKPVSLIDSLDYSNLSQISRFNGFVIRQPTLSQKLSQQQKEQSSVHTFAPVEQSGCHLYRLMSVLAHIGDVNSGHFVTYRRSPPASDRTVSDKWLYTSDLLVRKVSLNEVLATNAYMLFYEKL